MKKHRLLSPLMLGVIGTFVSGCGSDERLVRATQEADARQAEQNRELARVVADQQSVQKGIENQHERLDAARSALDDERRAIATERIRDPIIANALIGAVILAACALPLVLCFLILRAANQPEANDAALSELLIQELVANEPLLLPRPTMPAIESPPPAGVTGSSAADEH